MTSEIPEIRTVTIERELAHPPEKIWRALTLPHLIEEWLMNSDFAPIPDHSFQFRADWGSVDCKVLAIEPHKTLSYSWDAMGLESTVTWTLTPTRSGTLLRMDQEGFRRDQEQAYRGAQYGWKLFVDKLGQVLEGDLS
jgi:uncharacterized protein YndB with AHSA1/START domain